MDEEPAALRVAEVARRTGYSAAHIRALADTGKLRSVRTAGGERRFYESDIVRFVRLLHGIEDEVLS